MRESFLDVLRFVAALAVLLYHFGFRGYTAPDFQAVAFPELSSFARYGYLGVDLFFMISGYVIPMSAQGRTLKEFVILRMIRLYPTFWLCMLITAAVVMADGKLVDLTYRDVLGNLTMMPVAFGLMSVDGAYWSLMAEIQFYAVVGLIMLFSGTKNLSLWLLAWMVGGAIAKILGVHYPAGNYYMLFCAGAGCFFFNRERNLTNALLLIGGVVLSVAHAVPRSQLLAVKYAVAIDPVLVSMIILLCVGLIFISPSIKMNVPAVATIGGLTYPLYLLHQNIGTVMLNNLLGVNRWGVLALVLALLLVASHFVYKYFDLPIRKILRSRFFKGEKQLKRICPANSLSLEDKR